MLFRPRNEPFKDGKMGSGRGFNAQGKLQGRVAASVPDDRPVSRRRTLRAEVETPEKAALVYRDFVRTAVRRSLLEWKTFRSELILAMAAMPASINRNLGYSNPGISETGPFCLLTTALPRPPPPGSAMKFL